MMVIIDLLSTKTPTGALVHRLEMMKRKLWEELATSLHQILIHPITKSPQTKDQIGVSDQAGELDWPSASLMHQACKLIIFLLKQLREVNGIWDSSLILNQFWHPKNSVSQELVLITLILLQLNTLILNSRSRVAIRNTRDSMFPDLDHTQKV